MRLRLRLGLELRLRLYNNDKLYSTKRIAREDGYRQSR